MAVTVWGNLSKSQSDNEKIEEAIIRLITEHNDDETAHLGVGQSLQSHKASEIIDHLAYSVVADKIDDFAVVPEKISQSKVQVWPSFESLDCWEQSGTGSFDLYLGGLYLGVSAVNGAHKTIYGAADIFNLDLSEKNPVYECVVRINSATLSRYYFGLGDRQTDGFGFKVLNGVLYTYNTIDETEYNTEIPDIDPQDWHTYRIVSTSGVDMKFYIDDVLVHTETVYLPQVAESLTSLMFTIITNETAGKTMYISAVRFYKDR